MAVYVDQLKDYGGTGFFKDKKSCHMYADTEQELHDMAEKIGMKRAWFQTHKDLLHYDLVESRRNAAIEHGSIEHTIRDLMVFMRNNKGDKDE